MNHDQIAQKAPAVFALNPHNRVSENYHFVPTIKVLEAFESVGFNCIAAKQQHTRLAENKDTTKHTLLLRRGEDDMRLRERLPTVRLINSHDWSSTFQVLFGMLEVACKNGLYFAGPSFESYVVRHDTIIENVLNIANRFNSAANRMDELVQLWQQIEMQRDAQMDFSRRVSILRFGEDKVNDYVVSNMLAPRRQVDMGNALWTVFNRVQENALVGGIRVGRRASRAIGNIAREKELNEQIFLLAQSYAE